MIIVSFIQEHTGRWHKEPKNNGDIAPVADKISLLSSERLPVARLGFPLQLKRIQILP